jgi:hypothetical protein
MMRTRNGQESCVIFPHRQRKAWLLRLSDIICMERIDCSIRTNSFDKPIAPWIEGETQKDSTGEILEFKGKMLLRRYRLLPK